MKSVSMSQPPPPQIDTSRLRLRRWTAADALPFIELHDDAVMAWLWHKPRDLDDALSYFGTLEAHFDEHGFGLWAVERHDDGALIGLSGLRRVLWDDHPRAPSVEMVWRQRSDVWGWGYASEAASAALRDGMDRCNLPEVLAWTAVPNMRSEGVMRRIGMVRRPELDFDQPGMDEIDPLRRHIVYSAAGSASSDL